MQIGKLDHVNLRTSNLEAMTEWYERILGMTVGDRPAFQFPGAWLYCGSDAAVHLVQSDGGAEPSGLQIEHFAFSATGIGAFLERLQENEIPFRARRVPGTELVQINLWDPDGNHIHVDFTGENTDGLDL